MCFRFQKSVCLLLASLVACIACYSPLAFGEDPPTQVVQQSEWEARIEAALDAKGEWAFVDAPLSDVCAAIQEELGIDVVLDVKALEDFGIDSGTPITRSLGGISNRSFLNLLLSETELTYTKHLGALWITTPEKAEARLVTKVYPVGDLLGRDPTLVESQRDHSLLLQTIQANIAPDSWDNVGGPGAIEGIHNAIVVSHTYDIHEQVAELFTVYRDIIADSAAADAQQTLYMLGEDDSSTAIRQALDQPFTAEFKDESLKEVLKSISNKLRIPIVIDIHALEDFGIDSATPISAKFTETRLRFALERILSEMELTYIIRDEVLIITTPSKAEEALLIGLYPVRDLVEIGDDSSIEPRCVRCDFDSLISVIMSTIAPDTWGAVGGPSSIGTLLPVPTIVIAQTQDAHEEIVELLTNLRAAKQSESARTTANEEVDPTALIVRSYPVYAAYNAPDEIVKLIMRASEPGTWDEEAGTFVQGLGMAIVVKHNASGHRQVQKLLSQLGVWSPAGHGRKGFGGGAVPVVGGLQVTPSGERPSPGGFF
ncbi:MAG: hypothetical protein O3C40_06875 [Planctomycetota bacterium]|nr:hypothetical protein [Planctomycetota bacterium]